MQGKLECPPSRCRFVRHGLHSFEIELGKRPDEPGSPKPAQPQNADHVPQRRQVSCSPPLRRANFCVLADVPSLRSYVPRQGAKTSRVGSVFVWFRNDVAVQAVGGCRCIAGPSPPRHHQLNLAVWLHSNPQRDSNGSDSRPSARLPALGTSAFASAFLRFGSPECRAAPGAGRRTKSRDGLWENRGNGTTPNAGFFLSSPVAVSRAQSSRFQRSPP